MQSPEQSPEVRDSPNGILGPWACWTKAPPDVQSCWDAVAVAFPLRAPALLQRRIAGAWRTPTPRKEFLQFNMDQEV